jgi:hypothetical protein
MTILARAAASAARQTETATTASFSAETKRGVRIVVTMTCPR